jgi:signal transduction histidine kinase
LNEAILVAEDEGIIALEIADRVRDLGYRVVGTVASGEAAASRAEALRPDLVLMDVHLRGTVDGVAAARRVRELGIPVIFLTAFSDADTVERAKDVEPAGYLVKPFETGALRAAIVTALHRHAEEARRRDEEAVRRRRERLAFLGALASRLAHEIRNPLAAILSTADLLEIAPAAPEDLARHVGFLRDSVGRIRDLLDEIQVLEHLGPEDPVEVDAREVLRESAQLLAEKAQARGVQITLRHAPPGRLRLRSRPLRLAVRRMLDNAIDYAPDRSAVTLDAEIESLPDRAWLKILVRDAGPGFSDQALERAFEAFFTERPGRLGLGLSLAHRLADDEGGALTIANPPGGGGLVTLLLPIADPVEAPGPPPGLK